MIFTPHAYQKEGIEYIIGHPDCGLFWEMGLGKTSTVLDAIDALMYDCCSIRKVLIVAPKKVAEATWQDEAVKWDNLRGLTFSTVLGTEDQRKKALRKEADIYVISRDSVVWLMELCRFRPSFDMLVVDESSSFKNPQAKRFRALRKARPFFKRIVILTGTPAPNNLHDIWAQVYLLDAGKRLGVTLSEFRKNYFKPGRSNGYAVYEWLVRDEKSKKEIYNRVSDICMSLKTKDYLKLPERIDNIIRVQMDETAKQCYKSMKKEMTLELHGAEITALNAAALSNKLLQMANGSVYEDPDPNVEYVGGYFGGTVQIHKAKLNKLYEIVEDNPGKPVLVFYAFKHDLWTIKSRFPNAVELSGADSVRDWNAGKIEMLVAHPASCGYGLNLQAGGNIIVWYGLTWSLEQYQQANARLYRQGQDKPVIIHHLVTAGTIDEQVIAALQRKRTGQDALMEAIKSHLRGE
ncbi:DEAD/DEAH box helicase [Megasphaera paucivorans]|uniref:SNF2 family N-terminal domain-containing protein n=1 Tax=Megasphaera paucivorans TaxID=349095 RepID=A0A1G9QWG7_9FIRM|nr:DEAD/DEAH box helicase [Megasphaera paucivorans]SDM14585.1 SNF2 family N-terminal domain-containing protein [Megasphaera paucivorans]